ncbi:MAG: glycosyl transferase [Ruminococcaceae bacterium]|nr:glycosyl transferase [Oscillospiraceae bacterium]
MGKHAYLIMAHNQEELLKSLIQCLDYEDNDIYVHLDYKWKNVNIDELYATVHKSKLIVLEDRIDVKWGTYAQIACELALLKAATPNHYAYYHLMSGMDLPLKKQPEIHGFFKDKQGTEFIHFDAPQVDRETYKRISKYNFIIAKKQNWISRIFYHALMALQIGTDRAKRYGMEFQKGANWFSITDELAHYVVEKSDWIHEAFRYARCGDEMFLQTLVVNSKFKDRLVENNFCDNYETIQYCIDWDRGSPYIFTSNDFEFLIASNMCFARKFDWNADKEIIRQITEHVRDSIC